MSIKIQIHFTGLALCYVADDRWKIDFLCDDHHRLFLRNSLEPGIETSMAGSQTMDIDVVNPVTSGARKGANFKNIFNIVADAHPGGVDFATPTPPRHKVSMSIQHATLDTHTFTTRRYGIKRTDRPADPFKPLRRVARIVSAEIELQNGGEFIFKVDGVRQVIPVQNNSILSFDNDCRPLTDPICRSDNDSQMFYELIKGRENPPVRFMFTRISETINILGGKKNRLFLSHPDGNCDPVVSDPPPN